MSIPVDQQGHPRHNEWIALPGEQLFVEEELDGGIVRISSPRYQGEHLFADRRTLTFAASPAHVSPPPSARSILNRMEQWIGVPYLWGGNWQRGIEAWLDWYPPAQPLNGKERDLWIFRGLDCSGLLYEASDGYFPRNTAELLRTGRAVPIAGKDPAGIARIVQPLDSLVYRGHIVFVLDPLHTIESQAERGGVVVRPLRERLAELCAIKTPADDPGTPGGFVCRRLV